MKLVIAGSRTLFIPNIGIREQLNRLGLNPTSIILGGASGIDRCAEMYARCNGIEFHKIKAEWRKYGRAAGPIRNSTMAQMGDALLAFWDGKSPGTRDMMNQMKKLGKPVYEIRMASYADPNNLSRNRTNVRGAGATQRETGGIKGGGRQGNETTQSLFD